MQLVQKNRENIVAECDIPKKWVGFFLRDIEVFALIAVIYLKAVYLQNSINAFSMWNGFLCMSNIGTMLIVAGILIPVKRNFRLPIIVLIDIVITFILFSDLLYFRYYSNVLTLNVLAQSKLVEGALLGSISSLIKIQDIVFGIDLLVIIAIKVLNTT